MDEQKVIAPSEAVPTATEQSSAEPVLTEPAVTPVGASPKKPGVMMTLLKVVGYIFSYTIPKDVWLIIFGLFILFQTRPMFPGEEWGKLWNDTEVMSRFMGMIVTRTIWLKWYYIAATLNTALILFLIFRIRKQSFLERAKLKRCEPLFLLTGLVYGVGTFFVITAISEAVPRITMSPATVFYDWFILDPYDWPQVLIQFLAAGLLAPFLEEIIFRGICLDHLKKIWPLPAAVITISVIFGILHFAIPDVFLLALWSILLCLLVHRSGSVLPGMIAHIVYNSLVIFYRVFSVSQKLNGIQGILIYLFLGILLLSLAMWSYLVSVKRTVNKSGS